MATNRCVGRVVRKDYTVGSHKRTVRLHGKASVDYNRLS